MINLFSFGDTEFVTFYLVFLFLLGLFIDVLSFLFGISAYPIAFVMFPFLGLLFLFFIYVAWTASCHVIDMIKLWRLKRWLRRNGYDY